MKEFRHTVIYHTDCALPLYDEVDVLVCGGGPAGIAAASMAARQGRSVLLVERLGFLGGAAVAGGSGTVCGTFLCSDTPEADGPRQTVFGFTEEFLQAMRARGGVTPRSSTARPISSPTIPRSIKKWPRSCAGRRGGHPLSTIFSASSRRGIFFMGW